MGIRNNSSRFKQRSTAARAFASAAETERKQSDYKAILICMFGLAMAEAEHDATIGFAELDITSGAGWMPDRDGNLHRGSPLVAQDVLIPGSEQMPCIAIFIDNDRECTSELDTHLRLQQGSILRPREQYKWQIILGDHHDDVIIGKTCGIVFAELETPRGLIYFDPKGGVIPINAFVRVMKQFDFDGLIHISATNSYKRGHPVDPKRTPLPHQHKRKLVEDIEAINPRHLLVKLNVNKNDNGPTKAQQWTTIFMTNDKRSYLAVQKLFDWVGGYEAWEMLDDLSRPKVRHDGSKVADNNG